MIVHLKTGQGWTQKPVLGLSHKLEILRLEDWRIMDDYVTL